jgi:hypothetical protein
MPTSSGASAGARRRPVRSGRCRTGAAERRRGENAASCRRDRSAAASRPGARTPGRPCRSSSKCDNGTDNGQRGGHGQRNGPFGAERSLPCTRPARRRSGAGPRRSGQPSGIGSIRQLRMRMRGRAALQRVGRARPRPFPPPRRGCGCAIDAGGHPWRSALCSSTSTPPAWACARTRGMIGSPCPPGDIGSNPAARPGASRGGSAAGLAPSAASTANLARPPVHEARSPHAAPVEGREQQREDTARRSRQYSQRAAPFIGASSRIATIIAASLCAAGWCRGACASEFGSRRSAARRAIGIAAG